MKIQIQKNCQVMTDKPCVGFLTEGARSDPDIRAIPQNAGLLADKAKIHCLTTRLIQGLY